VKILVTGACGRIGSHVVRQLLAQDVDVLGVDSVVHAGHLGEAARRVALRAADVQDLAALLRIMREDTTTRVIHLAAALGDQYDTQPWGSYQVNLGGTINVLEAARLAGVERVVAASTHNIYPRAYGEYGPPTWRPIAEDHPPDPRRPYAVMKLAGEYMGRIYAERFGVDFAAVRFASYYGAERAIRRGNKFPDLLNGMILDAVEGIPTTIERGGDQVFDPVYIKDCAHGIIRAALADGPRAGRIYNIGGGSPRRLADAAALVERILPGARVTVGPGLPEGHAHHPPLDIGRARAEIGYAPQFTLEAGIADCAAELRILKGRRP
jgi:UDP-glucose 4-epimerase